MSDIGRPSTHFWRPSVYERGYGFVGINQANSDAVMEISSRAQMTKALLIFLIMISPAVTDDQNVTDFDPLKFRLE